MSELDQSASGKRRSFSQRVGADGELAFRFVASREGLIATKVEEDFGIDFMCQVDLDHRSRKASNIASTVIGACVRATTAPSGVVHLSPSDARNLLNSGTPLVFVLVHLSSDAATSPVYYRLVDEVFIDQLHVFLMSGKVRMDVAPDQCKGMDDFRDSVGQMLSHGYSERVRVAVAEARVNSVLPSTTVQVRTGADGHLTLVSTVDYYSLFERMDQNQERQLLHAAFGAEEHAAARIAELSLRQEVIDYLTSLPQPLIFAGFSREMPTALRVVLDGEIATEPFSYRAIGTHSGYVHPAGISLIISAARDHDGQMMHETELYVDPDVRIALDDLTTTLDFFAHCSAGAKIYGEDDDPSRAKGFDISELFTALEGLASMVSGWRACTQLDGWPARSVDLRDFANPEVFNTIIGFAKILEDPTHVPASSLALAAYDSVPEGAQLEREPATILLPVVGNLRQHSLILHLTIAGSVVSYDDKLVAFEFDSLLSATCEARDHVEKSTIYPEIVAAGHMPTLCLGRSDEGRVPAGLEDLRLTWTTDEDHR